MSDKSLAAIQAFDSFDRDNDPLGEHEFVSVDVEGQSDIREIRLLLSRDGVRVGGSPSNPVVTMRVLTIMLLANY